MLSFRSTINRLSQSRPSLHRQFKDTRRELSPLATNLNTMESNQTLFENSMLDMPDFMLNFPSSVKQSAESVSNPIFIDKTKLFTNSEQLKQQHRFFCNERILEIIKKPETQKLSIQIIAEHLNISLEQASDYFFYLFFNRTRALELTDGKMIDFIIDLNEKLHLLKTEFTCEQIFYNNAFILCRRDTIKFRLDLLRSFQIKPIRPYYLIRFNAMFSSNEIKLKKFAVVPPDFNGLANLLSLITTMTEEEKQTHIVSKLAKSAEQMSYIELHRNVLELMMAFHFSFPKPCKYQQTLIETCLAFKFLNEKQVISLNRSCDKGVHRLITHGHDTLVDFLNRRPVFANRSMLEMLVKYPFTIVEEKLFQQSLDYLQTTLGVDENDIVDHFLIFSVFPETLENRMNFFVNLFGKQFLFQNQVEVLNCLSQFSRSKRIIEFWLEKNSSELNNKELFDHLIKRINIISKPTEISFNRHYDKQSIAKLAGLLGVTELDLYCKFEELTRKQFSVDEQICKKADELIEQGHTVEMILTDVDVLLQSYNESKRQKSQIKNKLDSNISSNEARLCSIALNR